MKKERFDISIDHAMMAGAKSAFDTCLKIAVAKAIGTGSNEGSATLKVGFDITNAVDEATGEVRRLPVFKYRAGFNVPMKDGIEATIGESSRLIQKENGGFMLVNGQISMDELMEDGEE